MSVFAAFATEMGQAGVLYGAMAAGQALVVRRVSHRWRLRVGTLLVYGLAAAVAAVPDARATALAFLVAVLLFRDARAGLGVLAAQIAAGLLLTAATPADGVALVAGPAAALALAALWHRRARPEPPFRFTDVLMCGAAAGAGAALETALAGGTGRGAAGPMAAGAAFLVTTATATFFCWLMHLDL